MFRSQYYWFSVRFGLLGQDSQENFIQRLRAPAALSQLVVSLQATALSSAGSTEALAGQDLQKPQGGAWCWRWKCHTLSSHYRQLSLSLFLLLHLFGRYIWLQICQNCKLDPALQVTDPTLTCAILCTIHGTVYNMNTPSRKSADTQERNSPPGWARGYFVSWASSWAKLLAPLVFHSHELCRARKLNLPQQNGGKEEKGRSQKNSLIVLWLGYLFQRSAFIFLFG